MKGIVAYYSATGNTKKIARAIHAGMKQHIKECDIAFVKEIAPGDLSRYDIIGIGSPIWNFRETPVLQIFIHNLPSLKGKLAFPFCTHGASPVGFMCKVVPALQRKGLTIIGYRDWYGGVHQLPCMPKPYLTDGHPDEIDLKEATDFGRDMAELGSRISSGETQLIPKLPEGEDVDPLWKTFKMEKSVIDFNKQAKKKMKIDMDKCRYPECRLCADNCPMNSIDFSVTPPVFKKNCIMDFLCEVICPEGAIEIDYAPLNKTESEIVREKYVKGLQEAAAKGRFRWLVPPDKIGWDTPGYMRPGHPRYVIPE